MPKGKCRKNTELSPLNNNLHDSYEVQKSTPLFSLWKSELTLSEFKILDTYLARINSHHPEQRDVMFEKGELERLLGVTKINNKNLDSRLQHLQSTSVNLRNNDNQIDRVTLFERSQGIQDENGVWQITLTCTPSAMKYFFNIEEIGYLRYKLRSIINISSRYSYILFIYLEQNRFRVSWIVSLTELKQILNCENDEAYSEYKHFNNLILKRCYKELNEKTELKYTYEPIRKGRKIAEIRFTVETFEDKVKALEASSIEQDFEKQLTFNDFNKEEDIDYGSELLDLLGSAALNDEFTPEQVVVIKDLVIKAEHGDNIAKCNYLIHMVNKMNLKAPKNRFNYLCKMIENDIKGDKK